MASGALNAAPGAGREPRQLTCAPAETATERKPGPLERGGTLSGAKALGVDAAPSTIAAAMGKAPTTAGTKFADPRWVNGTWDFAQFKAASGETDWDAVIDAEIVRRRALEENPEPSELEDEVKFDTSMIPWWAWVRRFHLPEAERVNGRAAMIGYAAALLVDSVGHVGLVDQSNSFFGKLFMWTTFAGVALIRSTKDLDTFKQLLKEATFYDDQWNATWQGVRRPSEKE